VISLSERQTIARPGHVLSSSAVDASISARESPHQMLVESSQLFGCTW
jgi:hypothetical protein